MFRKARSFTIENNAVKVRMLDACTYAHPGRIASSTLVYLSMITDLDTITLLRPGLHTLRTIQLHTSLV
jgi:hypothetical protein